MKPPFEAVLFDLGGVVLRIHFDRCFQKWGDACGQSLAEVREKFCFDDAYAAHEVSEITGVQYHAHICGLLNAPLTYGDFVKGWNSIYGALIPETAELIRDLKSSYRIYAFTNSNLLHREVWSEQFKEALGDFNQVFCSSQLRLRKPEPAAFARIVEETGIPKERFVFVDDLDVNVQGGERFGFKSILFDEPRQASQKVRSLLL